jgi:3-hydroxyisobutyrate dehydrogenase-like beta-hydroxyacid dehydrogenase
MTHIAFLGTGLLGSAFVEAAVKRGDHVTVWNRTAEKARALEVFGARVADSPADAVRNVTRVHLVLRDDAVVEEVVASLRPGLAANTIIVDHTTTQPALTAERSRRLNDEGVKYLHCPVFIGPAVARASGGTILAAGPRARSTRYHADLAKMAARVGVLRRAPRSRRGIQVVRKCVHRGDQRPRRGRVCSRRGVARRVGRCAASSRVL